MSKKNLTPVGKARKQRIVTKLLYQKKKTKLVLCFYLAVLPLLKKYVLMFEMKEPLILKVNDQQVYLLNDFLACLI